MIICSQVKQQPIGLSNYLIPLIPFLILSITNILILVNFLFINRKVSSFYFPLIIVIFLLISPLNEKLYKQYANQYKSEFRISQLKEYNIYRDCLEKIFNQYKKSRKQLHVAAAYEIAIPCSNIDRSCYHQSIFGKYPNISTSYMPEVIIFNDKDKFENYIVENKQFIKIENLNANEISYDITKCENLQILTKEII